ncbi:hypothetical protein LCGC14_1525120 [marine sediment metagenome]|uniref:Uncharacterized protein n=1 Tax=marine sediment metagenome TaxID=412755 RepID=A0A0F9IXM8_9ZZZZ
MSNNNYLDSLGDVKDNIYGGIKNKRSGGFVDCCEEYKFIRESNTISFNNKFNRMGLTHLVLDEIYNRTDILFSDIINPIRYGSCITIGIQGYTGTGKSELAELITLISKQANLKYKKREVELFLCWIVGDIYTKLKEIKKGDVLWVDESPRTVGKGSRTEKWSVDNALHSMRKMENTFIFVDPKEIKVDTCDLYLESAGMNFRTKTNRFMIMDDGKYYFGHIYVKLHKDEKFRKWYEIEKDKFIQDTLDKGGRIKAEKEIQGNEVEEKRDELYEESLEMIETLKHFNYPNIEIKVWLDVEVYGYNQTDTANDRNITQGRVSQILNNTDTKKSQRLGINVFLEGLGYDLGDLKKINKFKFYF